ncbi:MAG: hypothetical protein ABEI57_02250 [Halapricum sp.]
MPDDPEATLEQWKETMQGEHEEAIRNPDPNENHRIEGVTQVSYRVSFEYDAGDGTLEPSERERVTEPSDPELLSCDCGVRGMTHEEALTHMEAASRSD